MRPHLYRKNLNLVGCTRHPRDGEKPKTGGLWCKLAWARSETLSKVTRAKRAVSKKPPTTKKPKQTE
jgi:hypothetical protein